MERREGIVNLPATLTCNIMHFGRISGYTQVCMRSLEAPVWITLDTCDVLRSIRISYLLEWANVQQGQFKTYGYNT